MTHKSDAMEGDNRMHQVEMDMPAIAHSPKDLSALQMKKHTHLFSWMIGVMVESYWKYIKMEF